MIQKIAETYYVLLLLIALEAGLGIYILRSRFHCWRDTGANFVLAAADYTVTSVVWYGLMFLGWAFAYNLTPLRLPENSILTFIIALFLSDLAFYLYHRFAHRVRLYWAIHSVHHTSEQFNLSTAIRLSCLEGVFRWPFWMILPLCGVPVVTTFAAYLIIRIYQIPLHTTFIPRLAVLENLLLATPSAHRVHHGRNPQYIDRNYAGMTTIWDRLFGTYEVEIEPVEYGAVHASATDNPIHITFSEFAALLRDVREAKTFKHKLLYFIKPPGWSPPTGA